MFPSTRLFAALGFALAAFGAMDLPASAQGTVREHRGGDTPPAPKPTVDRDHRRGVHENDPVQWAVRSGPKPCMALMISNVRRESLGRESMITPEGPSTGWSKDGGNWMLKWETLPLDAPCQMTTLKPDDRVAIYSFRTQKYLQANNKWDKRPDYVWNVKRRKVVSRDGVQQVHFALYNTYERRYLMLCHDEADKRRNGEALCYYNTDQARPDLPD